MEEDVFYFHGLGIEGEVDVEAIVEVAVFDY